MNYLLIIIFSYYVIAFSQTEKEKWGKNETSYIQVNDNIKKEYSFSGDTPFEFIINSSVYVYRIIFSNLDGENCPFHPSCSYFLIESVKETNIFQGVLMFMDRFTRDLNFVERNKKYSRHRSGKFNDPVLFYTFSNKNYFYNK